MFGEHQMSQNTPDIEPFLEELRRTEGSAQTLRNYRQDLLSFARFFQGSNAEAFSAQAITPTDVREYRSYLLNIRSLKPATINRHLATLRRFSLWAQAQGLIRERPTDQVKG